MNKKEFRKTNQFLLPTTEDRVNGMATYDIYPTFNMGKNKINYGIDSLIDYILHHKNVIIDGYIGVFWEQLARTIRDKIPSSKRVKIYDTKEWLLPENDIDRIVSPYLGEEESVWGKLTEENLLSLFDANRIKESVIDSSFDVNIIIGIGAALSKWDAPVIYLDIPKNEIQYRARAGKVTNIGSSQFGDPKNIYKRFFFFDWIILNKHKKTIVDKIDIIVDSQNPYSITWAYFNDIRRCLDLISENVFRVRPWFEPGAWGGQWLKENIKGLNKNEINYAWSFELITPENGLLFSSNDNRLEISFDFLMMTNSKAVLGEKNKEKYGERFPIRFDFLDTIKGGNLSIQCHPSIEYIRKYFGETITQDETYYIVEATDNATVYLGFQESINRDEFKNVLEESNNNKTEIKVTDFVRNFSSKKHDFFLIPNGTIHSSGEGNLVLEISATPYIYTFKMYDWVRLDLDGNPRPINIAHAFNNLNFNRKGKIVENELISRPQEIDSGEGWKLIHLPTHPQHFYDVHRFDFYTKVRSSTAGSPHVLMLVEGTSIIVETEKGFKQRYYYAETFVIPERARTYTLINEGEGEAKVIKAFLK